MTAVTVWTRLRGRYQRELSAALYRRAVKMRNAAPLISFTFDDFPRSALDVGGPILRAHGATGTYYASLGLMNHDEPVGRICASMDLAEVLAQGHELGCHTFAHCDAWETAPRTFEESIFENRRALGRLLPGASFETMSYPISSPRPATKRRTGRHFVGCRGGGQTMNVGTMDVNYLRAFFLEQSRDRPAVIREMIDRNRVEGGWLILVTHDVRPEPSRFGCTPRFFDEVVRWAVDSKAKVLPVARALAEASGGAPLLPARAVSDRGGLAQVRHRARPDSSPGR
jgi:peptidoglycan/xylan/chitin deacetylase (PgdA/CDA1 family)